MKTLRTAEFDGERALRFENQYSVLSNPGMVTISGDWHRNTGWALYVIAEAKCMGSRVVVQLGDFALYPDLPSQDYLDRIEMALSRHDMLLMFVDGNHEDHDFLARFPVSPATGLRCIRPRVWHIPRAFRWTWHGLVWMGLGGAVSVDRAQLLPGASWWPQEELSPRDLAAAREGGRVDVLLTHDAPAGTQIPHLPEPRWPRRDMDASRAHQEAVRDVLVDVSPTHVFHGHMHSHYMERWILASGTQCEITGLAAQWDMGGGYRHVDCALLAAASLAGR